MKEEDPVNELPLLEQPVADACCTPLALTPLPEADATTLAERFAALGDPVRLRLVSLLANAEGGAVCVCDLTAPVGRSQGTVSHHLKVLASAGLITGEKRGRNMWYSVVPSALEALRSALVTR
ncbi:MAG TPA: metalloregulator ArsR/SmtB family transcription factor [Marmoricola sp.]|nr:metalloregulator ArsR/SmtB family transcription factor [Marmoricola sp.]